jgi:hypothetical protein
MNVKALYNLIKRTGAALFPPAPPGAVHPMLQLRAYPVGRHASDLRRRPRHPA